MIIISDIDDVLMPWAETVHAACIEKGLAAAGSTWTQWAMHKDYDNCTIEDWLEVVDALVTPNGLYHQPPYPGTVEALNRLIDAGHELHLVTARGFMSHAEQIRAWTIEWIEMFKVPGTLWFSQDKGVIAQQIGATHAIDDRMENIRSMQDVGVECYILTQPHNRNILAPDEFRVNSVVEFVERILSE